MTESENKLIAELEKFGLANRGTDLGGLLQWAMLHIQSMNDALDEANKECEAARSERDAVLKTLEAAKSAHSSMNDALRCDLLVNPYKTCAADFTSHVNIMMAHGVEPYSKKKRKKND